MFGRHGKFNRKLKEIDRKLEADDEVVKRLANVVLNLRVVTKQTELILRELQGDEQWTEDGDGRR